MDPEAENGRIFLGPERGEFTEVQLGFMMKYSLVMELRHDKRD